MILKAEKINQCLKNLLICLPQLELLVVEAALAVLDVGIYLGGHHGPVLGLGELSADGLRPLEVLFLLSRRHGELVDEVVGRVEEGGAGVADRVEEGPGRLELAHVCHAALGQEDQPVEESLSQIFFTQS